MLRVQILKNALFRKVANSDTIFFLAHSVLDKIESNFKTAPYVSTAPKKVPRLFLELIINENAIMNNLMKTYIYFL